MRDLVDMFNGPIENRYRDGFHMLQDDDDAISEQNMREIKQYNTDLIVITALAEGAGESNDTNQIKE